MRILGLDVGEKRIGIARVDSSTRIAVPVGTINADGTEWEEIARISKLHGTNFFVLGMPRSNEGNKTKQSLYVRNFAKALVEHVPNARIKFQDETLTSVMAEERLKSRKKHYEKGEIDAEAATIILQDFIENFKEEKPAKPEVDEVSGASKIAGEAKAIAKKNADKINLNSKKAMNKAKKWTLFGIPIIVVVLGLVGATIALKYRDHLREEREKEIARLEAEMVASTFTFTIRPGETIFDIKKNLAKVERGIDEQDTGTTPNHYTDEEIDAAFEADYDYDFLKDRPEGSSLEGYLYGETHEFYSNATVEDIIKKYLDGMATVISENDLVAKYAERGLSLHEGITLASVVQKEAKSEDQPTVAQVFLSRLEYGIPLGSDVTVSYALDVVDPDRQIYTDNQAALRVDSCYNTRVNSGLPCGPISSPGLNALLAVANPSDTAYFYFLTGDDGVMYYSYTEAEHIQNIHQHCQDLCNVSL